MDAKELIEQAKKAIYELDHEINVQKIIIAELIERDPKLYHSIMEKLNLV